MKKEFIKNVCDVDVDGFRGINTYTIKAMYNVEKEEGYWGIEFKLLDKFTMTWAEIERDGGISQVNRDLEECYNIKKD